MFRSVFATQALLLEQFVIIPNVVSVALLS
jgi:hypothetical protein